MSVDRDRLIELMRQKVYKPMGEAELVEALSDSQAEQAPWRDLIADLEREGVVIKTRYDSYGLPEKMNLVVGRMQIQTQGYGFVMPDKSLGIPDVYIPSTGLDGAMHKDKVIARIVTKSDKDRRQEGEVIRILERANATIVGVFEGFAGEVGFVQPDEKRIPYNVYIPKGKTQNADHGDKVVVNITRWPVKRQPPEGEIVEILGKHGDPRVEITAVARQFNLPGEFPDEAKEQLGRMTLEITPRDIDERRDLRGWNIVTIDGADAKDLDDAVNVELMENGHYRLGVHIADVAHYVREGTAIDREALHRGTSIYLLDRVIPMLPKELSNGICSLNPQVERLTLSLVMEINRAGHVVHNELFEGVIKTAERMTYDDVNLILVDHDPVVMERYEAQLEHFNRMAELRNILLKRREERGAVEFELAEAKFVFAENGKVEDIYARTRTLADSIIEEFMLVANETIAERFYWQEIPFVYRVHEDPSYEKISDVNIFLHNFNLRIKAKADNIHPKAFQKVMKELDGMAEERLISRVLLRSMMRARYSPDCLGHFGLAARYYCHFTSPIRRYPDLVIHRIMKETIHHGKLSDKRHAQLSAFVDHASSRSSEREQLATEAERAVDDIKKAEYMADKVGQEFEGMISGVISYGFFVELANTVEGMVHVSTLVDDYYIFDPEAYALLGRRTKKRYRLGDRVKVRVEKVNVEEHQIDFVLVLE